MADRVGDSGEQEEACELPRTVGRYDLLYEIASGGMASVYLGRARGAGAGDFVAVKCCHPHLRREEEFTTMFVDEARLAAKIHHPNVVAMLDVSEDDAAALFMVMEFVDGYSLSHLAKSVFGRGERIPAPVVLRMLLDTLAGMHAAHELNDDDGRPLNIVHRDVSPHNVLVGIDGKTQLMDFGIAKAESRLTVTREGRIKGKLSYMAPEQHGLGLAGPVVPVTRRADLYSTGVVLWEMLVGQRLFWGENDAATLKLVLYSAPRPPSQVRPDLPPELDDVVLRALERDPLKRFATAAEFAAAIEASGAKIATAEEVSAHVREALAAPIAERHRVLERFRLAGVDSDTSQRIARRLAQEAPTASMSLARPENSDASVDGVAVDGPASSAPSSRARRRRGGLLAGAAVLALGGIVVLRLLSASEPRAAREPVAGPAHTSLAASADVPPAATATATASEPPVATSPASSGVVASSSDPAQVASSTAPVAPVDPASAGSGASDPSLTAPTGTGAGDPRDPRHRRDRTTPGLDPRDAPHAPRPHGPYRPQFL